jgi:uncharacterized protein YfdQ (DUF2303 family)
VRNYQTNPTGDQDPENAVVAELATAAAAIDVKEMDRSELPEFLGLSEPAGRQYRVLDLEDLQERPRRVRGEAVLRDPESFAAYVNRHRDLDSTLWADRDRGTVRAVLDDHQKQDGDEPLPRWGAHRATLQLKQTEDWAHWLKLDGQFVDQVRFAEHLDDGAAAIVTPSAAEMIALAQEFTAKRSVNFLSGAVVQSGDVSLSYEETTQARAGQKGSIDIPDSIHLMLAPWEGCPEYELVARFRYRIKDAGLVLGYRLVRADRVLSEAFTAVLQRITTDVEITPYLGIRGS